jgi:hypothetical protein
MFREGLACLTRRATRGRVRESRWRSGIGWVSSE